MKRSIFFAPPRAPLLQPVPNRLPTRRPPSPVPTIPVPTQRQSRSTGAPSLLFLNAPVPESHQQRRREGLPWVWGSPRLMAVGVVMGQSNQRRPPGHTLRATLGTCQGHGGTQRDPRSAPSAPVAAVDKQREPRGGLHPSSTRTHTHVNIHTRDKKHKLYYNKNSPVVRAGHRVWGKSTQSSPHPALPEGAEPPWTPCGRGAAGAGTRQSPGSSTGSAIAQQPPGAVSLQKNLDRDHPTSVSARVGLAPPDYF